MEIRNSMRSLLWLAVSSVLAFSQSKTTAVLSGTILDPSGGAIPAAKVILTGTETGAKQETLSDGEGAYRFPLVNPGIYTVRAEKSGFSSAVRKNVEVTVGQAATLILQLALGQTSEVIEVSSEVALVETERTQQSNTLQEGAVRNLPINRRDYLTFSLLAPGVADSKSLADANSFRVKQTPDSGISFYGSNGRGNSVSVDGGDANDPGGGVRPTVSQEAVQEFQVNRTNYSAEHGSARGGVVNIVTKSGSNDLHGSAFGFFRQQSMDATDPFALVYDGTTVKRVKPDANRQQYGGTIGGPITKDKLFYFMSYEGLRRRERRTVPVLTDNSIFGPTPAQEAILNQLPAAAQAQLRLALSTPAPVQEMFRLNSGVFPFETDDHKGLIRLDYRKSDKDIVSLRQNVSKIFETNEGIGALVGFSRGFVQDFFDSTTLGSWTHTFSPSLTNELRLQYNYYDFRTESNDKFGPALEIAGFGLFNRDRFLPSRTLSRRADVVDNLSWFKGKHNLKAGFSYLWRSYDTDSKTFMSGRFTFGSLPGSLVNAALASTSITALQAFNLGLAQSYQQGFGDGLVRGRSFPLVAGFVQDSWKVASNLTFDVGLRYEVDNRKAPLPTSHKSIGPRAGFAWDPFKDHKTTVRGGYGLFYAPIDFQIDYVVNALNEIDGFRQIAQVLTTLNPAAPTAPSGPINVFSTLRAQGVIGIPTPLKPITAANLVQFGINISQTGPRPPLTVIFRPSPDYTNPYAQQASFGIEREIMKGFSFGVSYVFVRGAKLTTSHDDNLLDAPVNPAKGIRDWGATATNPTGTAFFKNPLLFQDNVYESTANSFYHGMMVEATRRFNRHATVSFNYTFSKAIDETVDYNSDFQANDQLNRRAERALSSFDQRHKVVLYAILQSPRAGDAATPAKKVFGDFLFTPIVRYNSARPFNLLAGTELNNDRHNTTDRPIFAGRNTGIGPSFMTFDMRLSRKLAFGEKKSLELIGEAFNLLNHLNYGSVNNTVGPITGPFNLSGRDDRTPSQPLGFTAAFDPRRLQLGLRFAF
jgi:Carboxypeptidase regulatory-like domain